MSSAACCCTACALGVRLSAVPDGVDDEDDDVLEANVAVCDAVAFSGVDEGVVCRRGDGEAGGSGRRKGELRGEGDGAPPPLDLIWLAGRAWIVYNYCQHEPDAAMSLWVETTPSSRRGGWEGTHHLANLGGPKFGGG